MRYETSRENVRLVREPGRDRGAETGSFLIDAQGTIVGFDDRMEQLTGWTAAEVVGRRTGSPVFVGDPPSRADRELLDLTLRCKDGHILEVEVGVARGMSHADHATVSVLRVVSRSADAQRGSGNGRDPLTGLASREAFLERLGDEIRAAAASGRPIALVLADVDRLRKVEDLHGPEAAASILRKLAGIFLANVREEDLVARIDDDDFALMLPGLGRGSARQAAARLRSTVERFRFKTESFSDPGIAVTLSLGAASYPTDAENRGDLVDRAREALDEARAYGRNRVWCYTRRPRVPLHTPIYLDGTTPLLLGYSQDLSPSGVFVATPSPIEVGMRCALSFPLPTADGNVHVIGRVVRTVPLAAVAAVERRAPGMGVEFEKFGPQDRHAIEAYLFENESSTLRPEGEAFSV
jgi:diguanylate cyclase (GGDEF)-like protein